MPDPSSDAELVAYLDGELPADEREAIERRLGADRRLQARLTYLAAGDRPFARSFDALLAGAPSERLRQILVGALATRGARLAGDARRRHRGLARIAAAIFLFLAGAAVGIGLPQLFSPAGDPQHDGWREAVAEYLTLYTGETLAGIPDDAALRSRELAAVGDKLGVDLTAEKVALPGLALKRSQLFRLDGRPLAQIAYLSPEAGPVAFCIITNGATDEPLRFEERHGKRIVYWSRDGRAFLLIGNLSKAELEALAATLAKRVT